MKNLIKLNSITEAHLKFGIEKPKHPLVSILHFDKSKRLLKFQDEKFVLGLYSIAIKEGNINSFRYGRSTYDFHEGTLIFLGPGQLVMHDSIENGETYNGWMLLFHPDLIRKSDLGNRIGNYHFFSYEANEALHLSEDEKESLTDCINKIEKEISQNIDKHSQTLIISNIELLLNYCARFYDRQFYTRTNMNKDVVAKFEKLLADYYDAGLQLERGVPTVKYCAERLNHSSNYLSDLLKKETGRNALDHIHFFVIEKAKTTLLNSENTVSEIAYDLGFEYPQSFGKLFKNKTGLSPAKYRILN